MELQLEELEADATEDEIAEGRVAQRITSVSAVDPPASGFPITCSANG